MNVDALLTEPVRRLESYVGSARDIVQGAFAINFDDMAWQLPFKREASRPNHFLDFALFKDPFRSLLKAMVAHETAPVNGRGCFGQSSRLQAAIHFADVIADVEDLTTISTDHFYRALNSINDRDDLSDVTKYHRIDHLARISKVLNMERLTRCRINFIKPTTRPEPIGDKHMIPPGAIQAFGEIWQEVMKSGRDQDRLQVCAATILLCTGFRINELVSIPLDCWHTGKGRDNQGRILEGVWLGYAPEKNGLTESTMPRWVPTDLVPLVKECLEEIKRITEPFRENARNLQAGRVELPGLKDGQIYSAKEVAGILGMSSERIAELGRDSGAYTKIKGRGFNGKIYALSSQEIRDLIYSYSFLNKVVTEPWPQELHESLFVISTGFFNHTKNGMNGTATLLSAKKIYYYLASNGARYKSCFEIFNKKDPETGKYWRIATHDPRHTITTWMKRAGLSELEIAAYFGRNTRNPAASNRNYDHMQPWELLEVVRKALERGEFVGPWADILKNIKDPIRRSELKNTMLGNISFSKLGLCAHAEGTTPPTIPEACARCPGLIVVKGNQGHIQETKEQLADVETTIASYKRQMDEGYFNKERWLALEEERRVGLQRMLEIHLDPKIPHGFLVQLSPYRKKAC